MTQKCTCFLTPKKICHFQTSILGFYLHKDLAPECFWGWQLPRFISFDVGDIQLVPQDLNQVLSHLLLLGNTAVVLYRQDHWVASRQSHRLEKEGCVSWLLQHSLIISHFSHFEFSWFYRQYRWKNTVNYSNGKALEHTWLCNSVVHCLTMPVCFCLHYSLYPVWSICCVTEV